jgi:hypothetical protein
MEESIPGTSKGPNKNIKPGTVSIFDFFFVWFWFYWQFIGKISGDKFLFFVSIFSFLKIPKLTGYWYSIDPSRTIWILFEQPYSNTGRNLKVNNPFNPTSKLKHFSGHNPISAIFNCSGWQQIHIGPNWTNMLRARFRL